MMTALLQCDLRHPLQDGSRCDPITTMIRMSRGIVQEWFDAARAKWPRIAWTFERFSGHLGSEEPRHPMDFYLGGAASERIDKAWDAIDSECRAEVLRRVARCDSARASAEDLWGDALVRLMEEDPEGEPLDCGRRPGKIGRFRGTVPLAPYITVVARRIAFDKTRRAKVAAEGAMIVAINETAVNGRPDDIAGDNELAQRFAKQFGEAFACLSPTRQALLALVFGQGMAKAKAGHLLSLRDYEVSRELKATIAQLKVMLERTAPGAWVDGAIERWASSWTRVEPDSSKEADSGRC